MRPIELSLEGFTSFRSKQRLDFSELDLFAITGPTGAGKSSLLDAITYALYGTTTRSGKQIGELVSQGATNLKVQFRFAVRGEEYQVIRTWRYRPSTPVTAVQLESWQDGTWETLGTSSVAVQKTLEQILGMDFDTFTRVILLPQGQFDEFLKGDKAKRREILRQLAGFEVFERMRKEASELSRLLTKEREAVERQLADLEAPSPEEVLEKRSALASYEEVLPKLNQAVLQAQKALDEEEQLFSQILRLRQLQQNLQDLSAKSACIASYEDRLNRSQAANHLQGDWALVQQARKQYHTDERAATEADIQLTQAIQKLNAQQQKFEQALAARDRLAPELKARENALAAARVYEEQRQQLAREVALAQSSLQQKAAQLNAAERELNAAKALMQAARVRETQATGSLSNITPGGDRLAVLNQIAPLLVEWKLIEKQVKKNSDALQTTTKQRQAASQAYHEAASRLEQAEVALRDARSALAEVEAANAQTARLNHAAALRESLQPGDTCPVCGGVHPEIHQLPPLPVSAIVDIIPLRERELEAGRKHAATQTEKTLARAALEALGSKESECASELELTQHRLNVLVQQISTLVGVAQPTYTELEREQKALQESDTNYYKALAEQKEAAAEFARVSQAFEFAQKTRFEVYRQHETAIAEVNRQQQLLQESAAKLHELTGGKPYDILARELEEEKQNLANQFKAAEACYQEARSLVIQVEERNKQARASVAVAKQKREQLNATWVTLLETASFTEETFLGAIVSRAEQSAWEEAIAKHSREKIRLETLVKEVTESIGERRTDEAAILQRRQAKRAAEEKIKQANAQQIELSAWIQVAEAKQQQAENLQTQVTTLAEHEQTYHTLAQNLKANEFQAYILEHLEVELINRATLLLRELTDSRYGLQIEEGEYWVEDNWNGGEKRRVRTLSGGETFAASLSMAIALSEKLAMGAELGSLFLDEGFGTLDPETLESVTQILESLRQRSRMIGVITHVRTLAERLPTQVKVYKSPAGSRIEVEAL